MLADSFGLAEGGINGEFVKEGGEDREVDDLAAEVVVYKAEVAEGMDEVGDGAVGRGCGGLGGVVRRFGGEEGGEEGHGEGFEGRVWSARGKRSGGPLAGPRHVTGYFARKIA